VHAEVAAALERQLAELEDRRTTQAAEFEQRLAVAAANEARNQETVSRLQQAAQRAADARARLAAATAAAQVRLAVAAEEAGLTDLPSALRGCAERLRALPPDGAGDDVQALAALEAASTALATALGAAHRSVSTAHSAAQASSETVAKAQRALARASVAESRASEAESRCEAALSVREQARSEAERSAARLAESEAALATALAEAAAAASATTSQLHAARYEAASLRVRAETGERERDGARGEVDALVRDLAISSESANRLLALLRDLAASAGVGDSLAGEPLAACRDGSAAETIAALRSRLVSDGDRLPALEAALAEARTAATATTARYAQFERDLGALLQARDSALAERDGARAETASLAGELAAARAQAAERTAELAAARETLATNEAELARLRTAGEKIPLLSEELGQAAKAHEELQTRLANESTRAGAAEDAVDRLLDAARAAAAAAAAALDRFGLLDVGDSRRLTRATVRLDQAEDGVVASAGLGSELLDRAATQITALAERHKATDLDRLAGRERILALEADLAAARATSAGLEERAAAAERSAAAVAPAEARLAELTSELSALRGRLDDALRSAEAERQEFTVVQATALAEAEAREENARGSAGEAEARAMRAEAEAEAARQSADEAATRLAGVEAEAAARLATLEAGLVERDARLGELAGALDQARNERGETAGLAVRLRTLGQRLAEAQRDNARLIAEHAQPAAHDAVTASALHAAEHRARGLEAALAEERVRAEALVRSRERAAGDWQARLDRALAELAAERDRLADQETALADARAELAGAKARLRSLTSSEPTR